VVTRGDIWLTRLDSTVGNELQKTRPCVVISPHEMNISVHTVLVAPLTTGNKPAAFRVSVEFNNKNGRILLDHIRSVDTSRLIKRLGVLDQQTLIKTLHTLQDIFAE